MAQTQIKRYPVRGALFGLLIGLGAAYLLYFQFAVFGFDSLGGVITRFVVIIVAGIVLGVVWAYVAPARQPKGAPAAIVDDSPPPAAVVDEAPPAAVDLDDAADMADDD